MRWRSRIWGVGYQAKVWVAFLPRLTYCRYNWFGSDISGFGPRISKPMLFWDEMRGKRLTWSAYCGPSGSVSQTTTAKNQPDRTWLCSTWPADPPFRDIGPAPTLLYYQQSYRPFRFWLYDVAHAKSTVPPNQGWKQKASSNLTLRVWKLHLPLLIFRGLEVPEVHRYSCPRFARPIPSRHIHFVVRVVFALSSRRLSGIAPIDGRH